MVVNGTAWGVFVGRARAGVEALERERAVAERLARRDHDEVGLRSHYTWNRIVSVSVGERFKINLKMPCGRWPRGT